MGKSSVKINLTKNSTEVCIAGHGEELVFMFVRVFCLQESFKNLISDALAIAEKLTDEERKEVVKGMQKQ